MACWQAGVAGTQLTWMDAKVDGRVITPRIGKPVEIQALWYNALRIMQDFTGETRYGALANHAQQSFLPSFWNEFAGCFIRRDRRRDERRKHPPQSAFRDSALRTEFWMIKREPRAS